MSGKMSFFSNAASLLFAIGSVVTVLAPVRGYRILLIPSEVGSHMIYFSVLGESLIGRGNHVTFLAGSTAKVPSSVQKVGMEIKYFTSDEDSYYR